jgi:hypothetical protein
MALTPLHDVVLAPPEAITIDIRYKLDGSGVTAYSAPPISMPLTFPYTPSSDVWLKNGLYEWRWQTATEASAWRSFRAFAGVGAEGLFDGDLISAQSMDDPMPAPGSPVTLDSITIPDLGAETKIGTIALTIDFWFTHMWDLKLTLVDPLGGLNRVWHGPTFMSSSASDFAFDGTLRLLTPNKAPEPYDVAMVDGGVYSTLNQLRGFDAIGTWLLQWEAANSPLDFLAHAGQFRSPARIELIPD